MLREGDQSAIHPLPQDLAGGRARTPGGGRPTVREDRLALEEELARLRTRVQQQEHTLVRLTDAVVALRRGGAALREENRELRRQLEARRLAR
jgi:hypothetical protein